MRDAAFTPVARPWLPVLPTEIVMERYLTAERAATYLGLTKAALYQRVHRHTIPHVKWGRRVRFDIRALDKMMQAGVQEGCDASQP